MSELKKCYGCKTENELDQRYCIKCRSANFDMRGIVQKVVEESDDRDSGSGINFDPSRNVTGLKNPINYTHEFDNVDISRSGTGLKVESNSIILTTGQLVPNREIVEVVALVFAAGNAAWTLEGTSNKSNTAMGKAAGNIMIQAEQLGADAVVAIQMSMDGSGTAINRSQTVTLIGTAVKLSPLSD
jgi:uncharacterized protein YbjQ (UPF0145 family)